LHPLHPLLWDKYSIEYLHVSPCVLYQVLDCLFVIKAKLPELPGTFVQSASPYVSNMLATSTEAFPPLATTSSDKLTPLSGPKSSDKPRARRRSSGLGGEIRAGDTGAPAFATMDVRPLSPGSHPSPF